MRASNRRNVIVILVAMVVSFGAASAWAAVTGVISGTVVEAETDAPLSGANISVTGTDLSTVSDSRGRFVITNVPPGSYTVSVSLVGFAEAQITELTVVQGQSSFVEAKLEPTVVEAAGAEAKVTAARVALRRDVTSSVYVSTAAEEQMTLSQPNDRYQFAGLVFAQPGVVPDNTFYPHIRGARSKQVGYFLEGIPITEPDANLFATNTVSVGLDRLELYTGGYPAEYGGFTGGIINEVIKRGDQMQGRLVDVGAGSPYDFGGLILETGNVDGRANWYYGLNTWHSDFNENLFTSSAPVSSDHVGKLIYDAGDRDKVTLLSLHGYARYQLPWERMWSFDPGEGAWYSTALEADSGRQGHDIDSIALNHTVSPEAYWNLRLSRLRRYVHLDLGDPFNLYWQQRNERMLAAQVDYGRQMGPHRLQAGIWQINSDNNSRYSAYGTEFTPFGLLDSISNNDTQNTQAYLQDSWEMGEKVTLNLGARYDRMIYERPPAGDLKLDETSLRGGVTYLVSPSLMVRASTGRYIEFPRANLIAAQYTPNPSAIPFFAEQGGWTWERVMFPYFPVRPQVDRVHDLGLEWKVDESTVLTATVFRRESRQMMQRWKGVLHDADGNLVRDADGNPIPSYDPNDFDEGEFDPFDPTTLVPDWFAANGTGTARGAEVKLERRLSRGLRGWLSYTYLDAKATSLEDNTYPCGYGFLNRTDAAGLAEEFPLDWSQTHTMALAVSYTTGKLTVNPWVLYGSGFPYGQSGLDVGGIDPAHVPDPADPENVDAQLTVPENYADPNDPSKGFITPNSLKTGTNLTVSLNLSYKLAPGRELYLQIYNLFARDDVTSYVFYHPRTSAVIGRIEGGNVYYVPFSRTPPRFFALGVRQEF